MTSSKQRSRESVQHTVDVKEAGRLNLIRSQSFAVLKPVPADDGEP